MEREAVARHKVGRAIPRDGAHRRAERVAERHVERGDGGGPRFIRRQRGADGARETRAERYGGKAFELRDDAAAAGRQPHERGVDPVERRARHQPDRAQRHATSIAATTASHTAARTSRRSRRPKYTPLASSTIVSSRSGSAHTQVPVKPV